MGMNELVWYCFETHKAMISRVGASQKDSNEYNKSLIIMTLLILLIDNEKKMLFTLNKRYLMVE